LLRYVSILLYLIALLFAATITFFNKEQQIGIVLLERTSRRIGASAIPGHAMATSLLALGFAVGGRQEAEQMAARAMNQGRGASVGV
jgi:hypothetical protein